jgi:acyl phosphate:glycerol-3-phosphate acyltransferase
VDALEALLVFVAAYGAGSVPWGVVLGRLFQATDLRTHGSGGTGATNALRVLGWRISLAVFAFDFLKGFLPVLLARWLGLEGWAVAVVGVATVVGHCWSPFIAFKGGKGMATGAGAAAGMFPWVLLVFPLMVLVVLLTRYVSLASLVGSMTVSTVLIVLGAFDLVAWNIIAGVVAITGIIVVQHRPNIRRLVAGTERRFGEPAAPA